MSDNYPRVKATRIRKQIAAGRCSDSNRAWLADYESKRRFGGRAYGAVAIADGPSAPAPRVSAREAFPPPVADRTSSQAPPITPVEPPATGGAIDVPPLPIGGDIPSASFATPETPAAPVAPATPEEASKLAGVTALVTMAADLWKGQMDKLKEKLGSPDRMFPDSFVDKVWTPTAIRLGVKYLPESVGGDLTDAITVVVPPGATMVAVRRLSAIEAKRVEASEPAPAIGGEGETAPEAGPNFAVSKPSDLKNEIRKAKAPDMPKDSVF